MVGLQVGESLWKICYDWKGTFSSLQWQVVSLTEIQNDWTQQSHRNTHPCTHHSLRKMRMHSHHHQAPLKIPVQHGLMALKIGDGDLCE